MKNYKVIIVSSVSIIVVALFFSLGKANNDTYMPMQKAFDEDCNFNLKLKLKDTINNTIFFPTKSYLDSGNYKNIGCIGNTLKELEELTKSSMIGEQILSSVLTDSLLQRDSILFSLYNLDNLIYQMQWVEKFQYFAEIDTKHKLFFISVYDYWMSYIADKLAAFSRDSPSIKYAFKYKFLVAKCSERKYTVGVKVTAVEKVIDNIVRSKWGHLIDASWNQAKLTTKFLFAFIILIIIYGFYCIIHKHLLNEKKVISS